MFQFADYNMKIFTKRGVTDRKNGSDANNKAPGRIG